MHSAHARTRTAAHLLPGKQRCTQGPGAGRQRISSPPRKATLLLLLRTEIAREGHAARPSLAARGADLRTDRAREPRNTTRGEGRGRGAERRDPGGLRDRSGPPEPHGGGGGQGRKNSSPWRRRGRVPRLRLRLRRRGAAGPPASGPRRRRGGPHPAWRPCGGWGCGRAETTRK